MVLPHFLCKWAACNSGRQLGFFCCFVLFGDFLMTVLLLGIRQQFCGGLPAEDARGEKVYASHLSRELSGL